MQMPPFDDFDHSCMRAAMEEAKKAAACDEVPIGAVIADRARFLVLARAGNRTRALNDPTAHAEILAIRQACAAMNAQRIPELDLYVTLEPCAMCAGAISFARLRRIVCGALDSKGGGVLHGGQFFTQQTCHHRPEFLHGLLSDESSVLLKEFFQKKRL